MRLPTKDEFERLDKCYTKFDDELKGRWFYDEDTGENLFLPCEGACYGTTLNNAGSFGGYWSSTHSGIGSGSTYLFCFRRNYTFPGNSYDRYCGHSVRLVSGKPFEGAIHVAGLYWKPENEEGYYTYDEAMEKFDAK